MPIDIDSNNSLADKGLNITSISSVDCIKPNDDYSLRFGGRSSFNPAINTLEVDANEQLYNSDLVIESYTDTVAGEYNSINGYGLIDAAAAVGKAIGQNTFANVPNLGGNNWGADVVKAPEVWARGYTGKGVVVAVLDTGVDYNHDDLKANIWTNTKEIAGNSKDDDGNGYIDDVYGWNFDGNNNNILDVEGHGTHVSGTIAGVNNNFGVTGIAYDTKIMPVKVLDDEGRGNRSSITQGIRYAVDNGAKVINLSLGSRFPDKGVYQSAIEYASSKGVVVVMAAGNNSDSAPGYPARYADKWGLAVGAVDKNKNLAYFSDRAGTDPLAYVTAPGVKVYSTVTGNKYANYSGTSMAAPHVAGVVALMLSANSNLTDAQVRQIITETAVNNIQVANLDLNTNLITQSNFAASSFGIQYQDGSYEVGVSHLPQLQRAGILPAPQNQWDYVNSTSRYNYSISGNDSTNAESVLKERKTILEDYREWQLDVDL